MSDLIDRVRALADDVLFPAASDVDRSGEVPASHWELLASEGLYGLAAPPDRGGPGLELPDMIEILEVMAGGCLATTFTWIQHHGVVANLVGSPNSELQDELLDNLAAGRVRGGVAFAGVIPDPPRMTATRVEGGWSLSGHGPFVSGWGVIDVLQVSAGDVDSGDVIAAIIPADQQDGIVSVERLSLVAVDATATVSIRLDDLFVPDAKIASRVPRSDFLANQAFGARLNGSLPIGLARRSARLLEDSGHSDAAAAVRAEIDAVRERLDAGLFDPDALQAARAEGSELALRAAGAAVTAAGGPGLLRSEHAQRLLREAAFTLVAASRPQLKANLIERLTGR